MPSTARGFGCGNRLRPEENVRAGVRFLAWLEGYWKGRIPDENERLKFVLASYNAGPGHVDDACRLAQKHGDDAQVWDDVAYWMLQLSQRKFYEDPVVRYGFCRGVEPVTYVDVILERYDHYRQFVSARAREAIPVRTARICPASEMASAEPVGRDWLAHRRKTRSSGDGWPEGPSPRVERGRG
jgi:membrane-bound lytic murein transglycosylase F